MPRLFGRGPEGGMFEHLAHRVTTSHLLHVTTTNAAHLSKLSFTHDLISVQPANEVYNVQFVAVLFTARQVIKS